MKFTLEIALNDSEVEDYGIDAVLPRYLAQVIGRVESGNADAGTVWDVNGNRIGKYLITDD